jgi:hypothetical protein
VCERLCGVSDIAARLMRRGAPDHVAHAHGVASVTTGGPGHRGRSGELGACGERCPELVAGEEEVTVGRASSAVTREVCGGGVSEVGWL